MCVCCINTYGQLITSVESFVERKGTLSRIKGEFIINMP